MKKRGDLTAVHTLIDYLKDIPAVSDASFAALSELPTEQVVEPLVRRCNADDGYAIKIANRIHDPTAKQASSPLCDAIVRAYLAAGEHRIPLPIALNLAADARIRKRAPKILADEIQATSSNRRYQIRQAHSIHSLDAGYLEYEFAKKAGISRALVNCAVSTLGQWWVQERRWTNLGEDDYSDIGFQRPLKTLALDSDVFTQLREDRSIASSYFLYRTLQAPDLTSEQRALVESELIARGVGVADPLAPAGAYL